MSRTILISVFIPPIALLIMVRSDLVFCFLSHLLKVEKSVKNIYLSDGYWLTHSEYNMRNILSVIFRACVYFSTTLEVKDQNSNHDLVLFSVFCSDAGNGDRDLFLTKIFAKSS